ncbi:MAG: hypothetical protein QW165_02455 [Candidatus Woesearchaeota archaeon]
MREKPKCYWASMKTNDLFEKRAIRGDAFVLRLTATNADLRVKACYDFKTDSLALLFGCNGDFKLLSNMESVIANWERSGRKLPFHLYMKDIKNDLERRLEIEKIHYSDIASAATRDVPEGYCAYFTISLHDLIDLYFDLS